MHTTSGETEVYQTPVFEGSEKRLVITFDKKDDFNLNHQHARPCLRRDFSRGTLDAMLKLAECEIVSYKSNTDLDAYVLSESSMFVYSDKIVLKTCGTTKLLACVPYMLDAADMIGMEPVRAKYSRASFLFPEKQPETYQRFDRECSLLQQMFDVYHHMDVTSAYVLGDALNGLQWHVFVAGGMPRQMSNAYQPNKTTKTLEIAMTGLSQEKARQFFRNDSFVSSQMTTMTSGISSIVPNHAIDDYVFEPCGYSMNGTCGGEFSTIHITPEEGFSYASFEVCGENVNAAAVSEYVSKTVRTFEPAFVAVAFSVDSSHLSCPASLACPNGYKFSTTSYQEDSCGGEVAFFTLAQQTTLDASAAVHTATGKKGGDSMDSMDSVLKQIPSANTFVYNGSASDVSMDPTASENSSDCGVTAVMQPYVPCSLKKKTFEDVVASVGATRLSNSRSSAVDEFARKLINDHRLEDNFYIMDLAIVRRLYQAWKEAMPRVHPHYAVKCNNDRALLETLAALGAGFDCASEAEVEQIMSLGVSAERIIFANPCKRPSDIRASAARGIIHSTFDTESELVKLNRWAPGSRVLLRIRADDPSARCQLGNKFGAEEWEWEHLFDAARTHGVPVDGVSFHVGSGATDPNAFIFAIELAKKAFDLGKCYGFDMHILDVGGGFCGGTVDMHGKVDFRGVSEALNAALEEHFPECSNTTIIAEPGRFFTESIATLGTLVYGRRSRPHTDDEQSPIDFDYWITDGLYGSMNCLLYDHATLAPRALVLETNAEKQEERPLRKSTVFGPTCDGLDTVLRDYSLPEMEVGDWLMFPGMGAYTLCGASKFNGINAVDVPTFYVCSHEA